MPYAILTAIGGRYKNEAGNESAERFEVLEGSAKALQAHIALAEMLKLDALGSAGVATDLPQKGLKGERVKALVHFHEHTAKRWSYIQMLNAQVAHMRKWLSRQGVHQTAAGEIIWSKSTRKVEYDSTLEAQGLTRITFNGGLLYQGNKLFDTGKMVTHFSGPYHAIYVMSKEGNFHVSSHAVGHRHHSSLLGGQHVAGAGEIRVFQGRIMFLSNKSGHYHPDLRHLFQTLAELQKQNVPLTFSIKTSPDNRFFENVDAFFEFHHADNEAYKAHQVFKAVDTNQMSRFLRGNDLLFLTAGVHNVGTTGFHEIRDGQPPYWRSPQDVAKLLLDYSVPMTSTYVKTGAGR